MPRLNTFGQVHGYGKPIVRPIQIESADGTQDAYVVKYNTNGTATWAARIAGAGSEIAYGLFCDAAGSNFYVVGEHSSSVLTFYNADGTFFSQIFNSGGTDVFIARYNSNGVGQWTARVAGTSTDTGRGVSVDSEGSVYVTGSYTGTVTFFNADRTSFGTLTNAGVTDVFLVKYNSSGVAQWRTRIAGTSTDTGFAIANDSTNNVIVTGQYTGTVTIFNVGGGTFGTLTNSGGTDVFVVEYNSSGTAQWATRIAGTSADIGYGIATDSSNNIYVTGSYTGTVTIFNVGGGTFSTLTNSGGTDVFVVEYNSSGTAQWARRIAGTTADVGLGIAVDSSASVYVTGSYTGTATIFNAAGGTFGTLTNSGGTDAFIVKYDSSGTPQWATRISSTGADVGYGIAVDSSANVYVTGQFLGTATVFNADGSTFGTLSLTNTSASAAFLVKYNSSGVVRWATRVASSSTVIGWAMDVDANGNIYSSGQFVGTPLSIYGQTVSLFSNLANVGNTDVFMIRYNTNGAPQWAARIASTVNDEAWASTIDSSGNMYVGGNSAGGTLTIFNADGSTFGTRASTRSFLVKYNSSGVVQWAVRMTGAGVSQVNGIAVDSTGNVFAGGNYRHATMTIWNSDDTTSRTLTGPTNTAYGEAFLIKYNSSGVSQWAVRITGDQSGSTTGSENGNDVKVDSTGNVYICGSYTSPSILATPATGVTGVAITLNSGSSDGFLFKYNTNGLPQWGVRMSSTSVDVAYAMAVDSSDNVYVAGWYNGDLTVYDTNGTGFDLLQTLGGNDGFLAKYNSSGVGQWATRFGGTGVTNDTTYACAVDSDGNVYVGGNGTPSIYNADNSLFRTLSTGPGFLIKYNASGVAQWGIPFTGSGASIRGITTDADKNVCVSGNLGTDGINVGLLNSDGTTFANVTSPIALVKYDPNGFGKWVRLIGNDGSSTAGASLLSSASSQGDICMVGTSGNSSPVRIFNGDQTPYKILNTLSGTSVYIVKHSPTTTPLWTAQIVSTGFTDSGYNNIRTDSAGSVYVNGMSGTGSVVNVYNASGSLYKTIPNAGDRDVYIVKYDSIGQGRWTARIASTNTETTTGLTVDPSGNVIIGAASFSVAPTIYNSDDTTFGSPTISGGTDIYVVKYNSSGFAQWFGRLASTGEEYPYGLASDSSGSVYLTGHFAGTVSVFSAGGISTPLATLAQSGGGDAFIAKWDSSGVAQWRAKIATTAADYGIAVATDPSGNVYVTGFYGAATATVFNANDTSFGTLISGGGDDVFVVKYNTTGTAQWAARMSGSLFDGGRAIATDSSGNVYVAGGFSSTALTVVNANGTNFESLTGSTPADVFLVKYNTNGVAQWATRMRVVATSATADFTTAVAVDSAGDVYVAGYTGGTSPLVAFNATSAGGSGLDPAGSTSISTPAVDGRQTFIVKYNSSGVVQWLSSMGGFGNDEGRGITVDSANNIYTTGIFNAGALVPFSA